MCYLKHTFEHPMLSRDLLFETFMIWILDIQNLQPERKHCCDNNTHNRCFLFSAHNIYREVATGSISAYSCMLLLEAAGETENSSFAGWFVLWDNKLLHNKDFSSVALQKPPPLLYHVSPANNNKAFSDMCKQGSRNFLVSSWKCMIFSVCERCESESVFEGIFLLLVWPGPLSSTREIAEHYKSEPE